MSQKEELAFIGLRWRWGTRSHLLFLCPPRSPAPLVHLPHSRCLEFTQWRWWDRSLLALPLHPAPHLPLGIPATKVLPRWKTLRSVTGCAHSSTPEAPSSARLFPPLSGDWTPTLALLLWTGCRGGAFQCSATAPSRFVIRQKAADCCNRYFSLKKLRSNLGEPFSMNTFTPERSLFSASTWWVSLARIRSYRHRMGNPLIPVNCHPESGPLWPPIVGKSELILRRNHGKRKATITKSSVKNEREISIITHYISQLCTEKISSLVIRVRHPHKNMGSWWVGRLTRRKERYLRAKGLSSASAKSLSHPP